MTEISLQNINLCDLKHHPKNPRAIMRQHVVDGIASDIKSEGFDPSHALIVRPVESHFEIISGHHRFEAAKKVGLTELPCWVRQMNDESAFFALVKNNRQGELSPLEIGLHALEHVELDKRGMGAIGGGLKGYAEGVGYAANNVSKYRNAAIVYQTFIKANVSINDEVIKANESLLDKTNHLGEIHKAQSSCWNVLVELLLSKDWTVAETRKSVITANEFEIPDRWEKLFLSLPKIVYRALDTFELSAKTIARVIEAVEAIESRISTYRTNTQSIIDEFHQWLSSRAGEESWDTRKIVEYGRELQARAEAAEREDQERFLLSDWRDCLDKLQDESVSLVLTDPPYGMDYQSDYRLDRDKERKHETIEGDSSTEDAVQGITDCLTSLHSKMKSDAHLFCFCHWSNEGDIRKAVESAGYKIRGSLIWVKNNTGMGDPNTTFAPKHERIIHAVKGSPVLFSRSADVLLADRCNSDRHPTEKPISLLKQLIEVTTTKDEIVVDPFAGVASTLVAAKELGRAFFGCEINESYYNKGAERL